LALSLAFLAPVVASGQGIERPRVPLRTALDELRAVREAYAEAYNRKDVASVADMYAPDAIVIRGDGTVDSGREAIRKGIENGKWPKISITSDTVQVFGNTAVDLGTLRATPSGGSEQVSHYLVVLRRGLKDWKVNRVAVVPEAPKANAGDDTAH
jgi:uncharacterized protein (TIGR02246 family)